MKLDEDQPHCEESRDAVRAAEAMPSVWASGFGLPRTSRQPPLKPQGKVECDDAHRGIARVRDEEEAQVTARQLR